MYEIDARNWKSGKKFVNVYRCFNALNSTSSAADLFERESCYRLSFSMFSMFQTV